MPAPACELRVEVVTAVRPAGELVQRWRELAVAAENPFAMPEWHAAWVGEHRSDEPFVVVGREPSGEVVGIVPLVLRRRRLLAAGEEITDWSGPACAPGDEARVATAIIDALSRAPYRWDVWQLDRCRAGGAWLDGLLRATVGSAVRLHQVGSDDVVVSIDLDRDGPGLTTAKKRRELERSARRLRENHTVTLRRSTSAAQVERDLDVLLSLRAARWPGACDTAAERSLREFAASLARRQTLRLWAMDVDGEPAGVLLGWRLRARAFAYSHAFDPAFGRYGTGKALLAHAICDAHEEGCTHFDMLRGYESYKRDFPCTPEVLVSYRAVRRRSLASFETTALVGARTAYRRLSPRGRARVRRALRI